MHKTLTALALTAVFAIPLVASADETADKFFSKKATPLTPQDRAALDIAKRWEVGSDANIKPTASADGAVMYTFGRQQFNIICAVLQVCDVELQAGEDVKNIDLGDPRFTVGPAISGSGSNETIHLNIKPMDVGLDTTLVVTTDRRTYHFRLRSQRTDYMGYVRFNYPEDAVAKWEAVKRRETKAREDNTMPKTNEYLGDLSFDYDLAGDPAWKPVRVYNDGRKTIIQMPRAMEQTEAPTLLLLRKEGGLFTDEDLGMVNYRLQGDRYIVDSVFDRAVLIAGVGSSQDRVTITRRK
jgi:type IV secretion system protein VirB9